MDLRHLRYFACVAEEMHFGRAAMRLGISQPPLSQQIRVLEEELGVRLFDRTSRRVRLTPAGAAFLPEARQTLAQSERAAYVARRAQRGEIGRLAVGFTTSAPFVSEIATALYRFRQSHPQVEMQLLELPRDDQFERIAKNQLDLGIVRSFAPPLLDPGMNAIQLLEEGTIIAVRDDHPIAHNVADPTIADLAGQPLVIYSDTIGAGFNEHIHALCERTGFVPDIVHRAESLATLLGLVAAGFGATVIARSLGRLHVDTIVYRTLDGPDTRSGLWLVHGDDISPTGQAFLSSVLCKSRA